jgi:putative acetyltransferase
MKIVVDDLSGPRIAAFLDEHIMEMRTVGPPESKHALDLDGLRKPEITFWTMLDGEAIAGCGALKELDVRRGEIKSMRTAPSHKRHGIASSMLAHIIAEARSRDYYRLSLETGSADFFMPARRLYEKFGFEYCEPFADYTLDPNSVYMTKSL